MLNHRIRCMYFLCSQSSCLTLVACFSICLQWQTNWTDTLVAARSLHHAKMAAAAVVCCTRTGNFKTKTWKSNVRHHHTFIDLKLTKQPVKPVKPPEKSTSTLSYLNEIPLHFIHKMKLKGYEVIDVNVFLRKVEIPLQKTEYMTTAP